MVMLTPLREGLALLVTLVSLLKTTMALRTPLLTRSRHLLRTTPFAAAAGGGPTPRPIPAGSRPLGTQENLFAPRQYKLHEGAPFPSLAHVCVVQLSKAPPRADLEEALSWLVGKHPMLSRRVTGSGLPTGYLDALTLKMVRSDDPDPLTFEPMAVPDSAAVVAKVLTDETVPGGSDAFEAAWQDLFQRELDTASFDLSNGPLWRVNVMRHGGADGKAVVVFTLNHAIDDQVAANRMIDELLTRCAELAADGRVSAEPVAEPLPPSLEESVLRGRPFVTPIDDSVYLASKAAEGLAGAMVMPARGVAPGVDAGPQARRTAAAFRQLDASTLTALRAEAKARGVSVSAALCAAAAMCASDAIPGPDHTGPATFKVLQALNMRNFGEWPPADAGDRVGSVSCQAGSHDLMLTTSQARAGTAVRAGQRPVDDFWAVSRTAAQQTADFVEDGKGPKSAVGVFDWGMRVAEITNLVHLEAENTNTLGRAYSCGVSNAGVFQPASGSTKYGPYELDGIFFAVSHARTGSTYQLSALTVDGALNVVFHPAAPVVTQKDSERFADAFVALLTTAATGESNAAAVDAEELLPNPMLPSGIGAGVALGLVVASVLAYLPAWSAFATEVTSMHDAMASTGNPTDLEEFWDALKFWLFFAFMHPLLQPVLGISEALHASPGPRLADLVPWTFVVGNVAVLYTLATRTVLQTMANGAVAAYLLGTIGAGLAGDVDLTGYNLALNDGVRGCPTYEQVKQPSMEGFDVTKYQGRWYEIGFHDWTQFTEVYDTTLDIELSSDGSRWLDDFALKGPSPTRSPRAWDKSPTANGAHYFLYGKVDTAKPGVLKESGFGVNFPNYIVDVQKNDKGEYTEAIQFQCLERGGVRVFEGINFLSRNPTMTPEQLANMHARATKAGMDPYGSSIDQIHLVVQNPGAPSVQNVWQDFWTRIGVGKLLTLLESTTHTAFEDSGERVQ